MKWLEFNFTNKKLIFLVFAILIVITLTTSYYGSIDIGDYSDVAKFFAGEHSSKIRSSHSYLYGFIHAPFIGLANNFFIFKITSLISLSLIIYSVYVINNKRKKTLWLMLLSPAVWYMAPWINPIQLASLFLLWAFYFINKYERTEKLRNLFFTGIFVGLGWAVWDTILFFGFFLALVFLFNKKLSHSIYFVFFVLIGLAPRLLLDQVLFNFPFYTILKSSFGTVANFSGGIYGSGYRQTSLTILTLALAFLTIPLYFWHSYRPQAFREHKKKLIFLSLSLLLLLFNLQLRYLIAILPIIVLVTGKHITERQFKRQITVSVIVALIFITPYLIQVKSSIGSGIDGSDIIATLENLGDLYPEDRYLPRVIRTDIEQITEKFPNEVFVVGNSPDDYRKLAYIYWGDNIREFVSIQDYNLELNNQTVLFKRRFEPVPNINSRRQIWIEGGLDKNKKDATDYQSIIYGIGIGEPINEDGFVIIDKYEVLYLSRKIS